MSTIELTKLGNGSSFPLPAFTPSYELSDFKINSRKVKIDPLAARAVQELSEKLKTFKLTGKKPSANPEDWALEKIVAGRVTNGAKDTVNEVAGSSKETEKEEESIGDFLRVKTPSLEEEMVGFLKGIPLKEVLIRRGMSSVISEVSQKINQSNIDESLRFILSHEPLYVYALGYSAFVDNVKDARGLTDRVLKVSQNILRSFLNGKVAENFIKEERLDLPNKTLVINEAKKSLFPWIAGKVSYALHSIIEKASKSDLHQLVNEFFESGEIEKEKGTPQVKSFMVKYLNKIGVTIQEDTGLDNYTEYLSVAYTQALREVNRTDDPVTNVFSTSAPDSFNYMVDYFDSAEEQGVDVENILAAGTLYYIKTLADDLGILRIADSVLMKWTSGALDIPQGNTATKLYRYYKLRDERTTAEERAMFYKIVLDAGDGKVLNNITVNRDFTHLWDTLMSEVVKYIQKFEQKDSAFDVVSKSAIFQAIKDLQYNLTIHTSGMVKAILPEMYKQLESAVEIIDDQNVKDQLGRGFRRSMWNVIERISIEDFNYMPNVSALRTSAVCGHKIFVTIANFNEALVTEDVFRDFIQNVESFIIAQSQLGERSAKHEDEDLKSDEEELEKIEQDDWDF